MNKLSESLKVKFDQRVEKAKTDPTVFIDRFLYTFDPKREPYHLPFRLFDFQKDLIHKMKDSIEKGEDIFVEKCREVGVTYCALDLFLWFWLYVPGSNFLLGSRKAQYVDNTRGESGGMSNKEESLFGKLEYTISRMYSFLLPKGFDIKKHMTYMSLINPENGNAITGESSNPNFSRGGRSKAILLDEFAFWDNDTSAWGATADTTNCRVVLTTPGIRPSKAKRLRFGKDGEKIKVVTIPYTMDPRKTKEWLAREKSRRSEEDFAREIMINWETSTAGRVYKEIEQAEAGDFPYKWEWPLYTSWDFGLDGTVIQFWQTNMDNGKPRLIESVESQDKPIDWYFPFIGEDIDSSYSYSDYELETIKKVKTFKKAIHYGDPDVSKRSLLTGTSTRQALEAVGVYVQTNPESNDFISRRERTKVLLQQGIEVNRTKGNDYWFDCMKEARYPQRQETSQMTTPIRLPVHDWTSHNRTATEFFAVNYGGPPVQNPITESDPEIAQRLIKQNPDRNVIPQNRGMEDLF